MSVEENNAPPAAAPFGGVWLSCAVLILVITGAGAGVGFWGYADFGYLGLLAASVGAVICAVAALAALLITVHFAGTPIAMSANLGTMLIRMGLPLLSLTVLPNLLPQLAAAGLARSVIALYLVALITETLLALRHSAAVEYRVPSKAISTHKAMRA